MTTTIDRCLACGEPARYSYRGAMRQTPSGWDWWPACAGVDCCATVERWAAGQRLRWNGCATLPDGLP